MTNINSKGPVGILDIGLGNIGSIERMLSKAGGVALRVTDPTKLDKISALIIPGVGSFDPAMSRIREAGFDGAIQSLIGHADVPILGICLGMHLLCNSSEEGDHIGLGIVDAKVKNMTHAACGLPTPNMGWRDVTVTSKNPLADERNSHRFYFVHSFYVEMQDNRGQIFQSNYGFDFCCGFQVGKIFGVQFHPEKSHNFGLRFFENFVKIL